MALATIYIPTKLSSQSIRLCRECDVQKLDEAQDSDLYVCAMQPSDADELMHGVIFTREGIECHHHTEFEYYNINFFASWHNAIFYAYCADHFEV